MGYLWLQRHDPGAQHGREERKEPMVRAHVHDLPDTPEQSGAALSVERGGTVS
jgi:hypothetical protein